MLNFLDFLNEEKNDGTYSAFYVEKKCAQKLYNWCKTRNISVQKPEELHCTLMFSRKPVPEAYRYDEKKVSIKGKIKGWKILGPGILTLEIDCPEAVKMNKIYKKMGAISDFPSYIAHVTTDLKARVKEEPDELPDFDILFDRIEVKELDLSKVQR